MKAVRVSILVVAGLVLLTSCDKGPSKAQLQSDIQRLLEENRQLQQKVASEEERQRKAVAGEEEVRRLLEENRQLKEQLTAQVVQPQAPAEGQHENTAAKAAVTSSPRQTIDPEAYKAELNVMKGWTKQQVVARLGKPHETENGGQDWFYKFNAQDQFGVIYRHIQISFDDSGRVFMTAIGQTDMSGVR